MKYSIRLLFFVVLLAFASNVDAKNFSKSVNKKIQKRLKSVFSTSDLKLTFCDSIKFDQSNYDEFIRLYVAKVESSDTCLGYALFNASKGKVEFFDYMVIFDKELKIKNATVLVYRSSHGAEVSSKSWLRQFIGKCEGESMELDHDIDTISGATLSVESITYGIADLSMLLKELLANGSLK